MNVNDRNAVVSAMQHALDGKPVTVELQGHVTAEEALVLADELKAEHYPRYQPVHGRKTGPSRVTFELEPLES